MRKNTSNEIINFDSHFSDVGGGELVAKASCDEFKEASARIDDANRREKG